MCVGVTCRSHDHPLLQAPNFYRITLAEWTYGRRERGRRERSRRERGGRRERGEAGERGEVVQEKTKQLFSWENVTTSN